METSTGYPLLFDSQSTGSEANWKSFVSREERDFLEFRQRWDKFRKAKPTGSTGYQLNIPRTP